MTQMTGITDDQVEARIARLGAACDSVAARLVELDDDPTLCLLDTLMPTGVTAALWAQEGPKVGRLWRHYLAVREVVMAIARARHEPGTPGHERAGALARLSRPSVTLPLDQPDPAARRRTLIEEAPTVTIDEAMLGLERMFQEVVAALGRIGAAVNDTRPRLAAARARLAEIERSAATAGMAAFVELDTARAAMERIGTQVDTDPLGADATAVAAVEPQLEAARVALQDAVATRDGLPGLLAAAGGQLDALGAQTAAARAARAEAAVKIAGIGADGGTFDALAQQLDGLRATLQEIARSSTVDWQVAHRLLLAFRQELGTVGAAVEQAQRAATAGLAMRRELRSLLDSYRVMAQARGLAEDDRCAGLFAQAHTMLHTAPCDLASARAAVAVYRRSLDPGRTAADG